MSYKANVFQNTKEEWKNVAMTLSSANPNRSNIAPKLRTYWLDYGKSAPRYDNEFSEGQVSGKIIDNNGESINGVIVTVVGTSLSTISDTEGFYSITLPSGSQKLSFSYIGYKEKTVKVNGPTVNVRMEEEADALQEVVVAGYSRSAEPALNKSAMVRGTSSAKKSALKKSDMIEVEEQRAQFGYEFDIRRPLTLLSDGKVTVTEIGRYQLPATYKYIGIPRADKKAFLVADATGWQSHNLLEGEANVYFENSFAGKTIIDPNVVNDTINFSLGRDNGIQIKREKVAGKSSSKLFSTNQEQNLTWRITVKNTRNENVAITIKDQIPVSQKSDITVTTGEISGGDLNEETGIITWDLNLMPNEQKEMTVNYRVKYPKHRRLVIE